MASQIVSSLIGQLKSVLTDELKRRGKLVIGADEDVKKLASTFSAIEALLLDAEEKQLTNKAVEDWIMKLKNVCYKIDDVLDEWRTESLKHQLEKLLEISNILKRVCPFLPTYCFSPEEIGVRYDIASRIEDLYEDLEHIDKSKNMFNFTSKAITFKSMETSSNIIFSDVKGREEETKILKDKLLHASEGVQGISIQGTGGFGKTTLAKLLYNNEAVKNAFNESRIWICVSETFDPSKRFLLVLDDVWDGNHSKWQELLCAISCGSPGSKVLVTTRKGEVSRALVCTKDDVILMGKVPDDVCEAIFTQVAFHGWNAKEKERVEGFCKDVVKKCDGSPLAAKVFGGVMQAKKTKKEWLRLLKSEMWNLKEVKEEVFGPLALSYYDLTSEVRQCFQFCSIFPKDYEMDKDELIKLWISQGFVGADPNQEVEDIGEEYFQILASRSFFQDFRTGKARGMEKTYCQMHDLVHDFAQMLSKGECVSMTSKGMRDVTVVSNNSSTIRNLTIKHDSTQRLSIDSTHSFLMEGLRGFMARWLHDMEPDVWAHLCGIRSLILTHSELKEIPPTINKLVHLRHLDLSFNISLEELPKEICELYNLWTLIINRCYMLRRLPLGMGNKLVNLKHLENEGVPALIPKSITTLTRLKTLTTFTIEKYRREGEASIGDLEDMNQLQGSLIVFGLGNVARSYEVEQAHFDRKRELTCLALGFRMPREGGSNGGDNKEDEDFLKALIRLGPKFDYLRDDLVNRNGDEDKDEELLEAVRPSTNLEELIIGPGYMGTNVSPSWMASLGNLTRVTFRFCNEVKHLPPLGGLPSLEEVSFYEMGKVKKVGVEFLGRQENDTGSITFPMLSVLEFEKMAAWEEWDDTMLSSPSVMPRLTCLILRSCNRIKKLPGAFLQKPTLKSLVVKDCNILHESGFISEVWNKISHIPTVAVTKFDV
ncbi:Putative disease resistance protein RGA1 [Linum grandiflorum]